MINSSHNLLEWICPECGKYWNNIIHIDCGGYIYNDPNKKINYCSKCGEEIKDIDCEYCRKVKKVTKQPEVNSYHRHSKYDDIKNIDLYCPKCGRVNYEFNFPYRKLDFMDIKRRNHYRYLCPVCGYIRILRLHNSYKHISQRQIDEYIYCSKCSYNLQYSNGIIERIEMIPIGEKFRKVIYTCPCCESTKELPCLHSYKSNTFLTKLEIFCENVSCEYSIYTRNEGRRWYKRKMVFWGYKNKRSAIYICPICNKKRIFIKNRWNIGFHERIQYS